MLIDRQDLYRCSRLAPSGFERRDLPYVEKVFFRDQPALTCPLECTLDPVEPIIDRADTPHLPTVALDHRIAQRRDMRPVHRTGRHGSQRRRQGIHRISNSPASAGDPIILFECRLGRRREVHGQLRTEVGECTGLGVADSLMAMPLPHPLIVLRDGLAPGYPIEPAESLVALDPLIVVPARSPDLISVVHAGTWRRRDTCHLILLQNVLKADHTAALLDRMTSRGLRVPA